MGEYRLSFKWDNGIEVNACFKTELAAKQYYGQHIQSPMVYPRAKWKGCNPKNP